ncbi:MAG: hypothetical protein ACOX3F_10560 [Kiritimatiellia bacterium]|jgi:hypothetical protein
MEFINLLKTEVIFLLKRKEFLYVFTISLLFMLIAFFVDCFNLFQKDIMYIPPANQLWVGFDNQFGEAFYIFLLPLLPALAYADTHYLNNKTGAYKNILTRCRKSNYILAKGLVVFATGFAVIFAPLIVNQLLYFIIAPLSSSKNILNWPAYMFIPTHNMVFRNLFLNSPYLYNVIYMILASLVGSIAALMSYAISFVTNRSRLVIVAMPLVIYLIYNFVNALLISGKYCLNYYLIGIGVPGLRAQYFFTVLLVIFIVSITVIFFRNLHKDELL